MAADTHTAAISRRYEGRWLFSSSSPEGVDVVSLELSLRLEEGRLSGSLVEERYNTWAADETRRRSELAVAGEVLGEYARLETAVPKLLLEGKPSRVFFARLAPSSEAGGESPALVLSADEARARGGRGGERWYRG